MVTSLLRILTICCLSLYTSSVLAWGNLGHRITGLVAAELLTPVARRDVELLLGDESLADAATYMDTHRDELRDRWPESPRWHYDNREVCGGQLLCRDGDCATRRLEQFQHILANKAKPRSERVLALRLVIHIIGDIHQPLHVADNHDRGGNDIWVRMYAGAERHRLHEVLDTELVRDAIDHRRDYIYARELLSTNRTHLTEWQNMDVNRWANESYAIGKQDIYQLLPQFSCNRHDGDSTTITLSPAFVQLARKDVEIQLVKAGVRISAALNASLQ